MLFNWLKNAVLMRGNVGEVTASNEVGNARVAQSGQLTKSVQYKGQGDTFLAQGELDEAAASYRQAIAENGQYADAHLNLGFVLSELTCYEAAELALRQALEIDQTLVDAFYILGTVAKAQGDSAGAIESFTCALELDPGFEIAYGDLCQLLLHSGQNERAKAIILKGIALFPENADFHVCLGNLCAVENDRNQAIDCFHKALSIQPAHASAYMNLGLAFQAEGNLDGAAESYNKAILIQADSAEAYCNLGAVFQAQGKLDEAIACARKSLVLNPALAEARNLLGFALQAQGGLSEAIGCYEAALALKPDYAEGHNNLGRALFDQNRLNASAESLQKAIELKSEYALAHNNLGNVRQAQFRVGEAIVCYQKALAITPDDAVAYSNLGAAFQMQGLMDKAVECYQKALRCNPDFTDGHSNLLFALSFHSGYLPAQYLTEAIEYGSKTKRFARPYVEWFNLPERCRCLRVGFVSGDLCQHPVGNFLEAAFAMLSKQAAGRLELFAYASHFVNDEVTERIKAHCHGWCSAVGLSDERFAQRIRDDGIDILIDLSGHSAHNRLPTFAWKPAPIQATWLGYLATTGVSAIDYVIADAWTFSESEQINFTEKVWRLPESYLCFTPPLGNIEVAPLPAISNGYITFGSFNNLTKINDEVVALWSRVLAAIPCSRLYLKSQQLKDASVQNSVVERFAVHGIAADRLILEGPVPRAEYLKPFHRVDIALDPFPYPGITTSVETLWMGVPVLTLPGMSFLSRQGVGLLMNAGLSDWIAEDADDYVARAVLHAGDLQRLASLRSGLRQRVFASPIFDAPRFAQHFEAALRDMWLIWCDSRTDSCRSNSILASPAPEGVAPIFGDMMRLHVGGKEPKAGWKILNALNFEGVDFVGNVTDLSRFPDACCEKVYASHVMEHVGQRDFVDTLTGIRRILCANGEFYFSVPDLEVLCRLFLSPELDGSQRFHVMRMMFGGQIDDYDFHHIGLTEEFMMNFFRLAGFSSMRRVASFGLFNDTSDYKPYGVSISLNMIAVK